MFNSRFSLRILADKPTRLDTLLFWARWGRRKVRFSQLKRIIRDQEQAEAEARKKRKARATKAAR